MGDQPTEPTSEGEGSFFLAAPPPPPAPPTVLTGELAANEGGPSQVDLGDYETPVYSKVTVSGLLGYQGAGGYLPGTGQVDAAGVVIQNQCDLSVVIRSATGPVFASPSCPSQPRQIDTYTRYAVVNGHLDAYRTTGPPGSCWKYPAPCIHFTGSQSITVEPQEGTIVLTPSKTSVAPGGGIVVTAKGVWAENNTTLVPMTVRAWSWEGSGPEVGGGHTKVCAAYNTNQCTVQVYQSGRVVLEALVNGKVKTQSVEIAVVGGDTLPLPPVDTIPTDTIPTDTIPGGGGGGGGGCAGQVQVATGSGPTSSPCNPPAPPPTVRISLQDGTPSMVVPSGIRRDMGRPRTTNGMLIPDSAVLVVRVDSQGTAVRQRSVTILIIAVGSAGRAADSAYGHYHTSLTKKPTGTVIFPKGSQTDTAGLMSVTLRAGPISGPVRVIASISDSISDTVEVSVGVPGLTRLLQRLSDSLIGSVPEHPQNHYVIPGMGSRLDSLVDTLYARYRVRSQLNDASLPYGGKFDLDRTWDGEHDEHRVGRDLDFRTLIWDADACRRPPVVPEKPRDPPAPRCVEIQRQWERLGGSVNDETDSKKPHYHLRYRGN